MIFVPSTLSLSTLFSICLSVHLCWFLSHYLSIYLLLSSLDSHASLSLILFISSAIPLMFCFCLSVGLKSSCLSIPTSFTPSSFSYFPLSLSVSACLSACDFSISFPLPPLSLPLFPRRLTDGGRSFLASFPRAALLLARASPLLKTTQQKTTSAAKEKLHEARMWKEKLFRT